jgi:hypothetical protein
MKSRARTADLDLDSFDSGINGLAAFTTRLLAGGKIYTFVKYFLLITF